MKVYSVIFLMILAVLYSCNNGSKDMPPPEIFLKMPEGGYEIEPDSVLIISPKITYDYDSHYLWKKNGEVMDYDEIELIYESTVLKSDTFEFFVFTPAGADSMVIPVHTIILVDLEEFPLDKYTTHINKSPTGHFNSKGVILPVKNEQTEDYWSGFAISLETNTELQSIENQFSVFAKSGAGGSQNFSVFLADSRGDANKMYFSDGKNHTLKSISVNNSTYTARTIKRGDENAKAFDFGDWYKLTIKGYDNQNNPTGEVEFYLADYRSENNSHWKIVYSWTDVYLQELGRVNSVEFVLTSTDKDEEGYNTPLYFCIDNIKILD
jgi:hypothetical protein